MVQLPVFLMDIVKKVLPKEEIAPVAQLDRASDFGSEGLGFESLRAHHHHVALRFLIDDFRIKYSSVGGQ